MINKQPPFLLQLHPNVIQILLAVVCYKTKMQKPRRGLCSSWLASLDPMSGLLNTEEVFAAATFSLLYIVTGLQGGLFSRLCHRHRFSLL